MVNLLALSSHFLEQLVSPLTAILQKSVELGQISQQDALDAEDHFSDFDDPNKYQFTSTFLSQINPKAIFSYDDAGWLEIEPGSLVGLDKQEFIEELKGFRGLPWAEQAWQFKDSIPSIIVIETPNSSGICDGRGRFNLAVGLNCKLPVLLVKGKYKTS